MSIFRRPEDEVYRNKIRSIRTLLVFMMHDNPEKFEQYEKAFIDLYQDSNIAPIEKLKKLDELVKEVWVFFSKEGRDLDLKFIKLFVAKYKKYFFDYKNMDLVSDSFLENERKESIENLLKEEEETRNGEDEFLEIRPSYLPSIEGKRVDFIALLLETDYRFGMLSIMNDLLNHKERDAQNPFLNYSKNAHNFVKFLREDVSTFSRKVEAFDKASMGLRKSPKYAEMLAYKKELDYRMTMHRMKGEKGQASTFEFKDENPAECFFKMALLLVKADILMNQIEKEREMEALDKQVREANNKAEEPKSEVTDTIADKLAGMSSDLERYQYQIAVAKDRGLIRDDNLLEFMDCKRYLPRAALNILKRAEEKDEDLIVFPPIPYSVNNYRIYSKRRPDNFTKVENPFKESRAERDKVNLIFIGKLPADYIGTFYNELIDEYRAKGRFPDIIRYKFDEKTGLYTFYRTADRKGNNPDNQNRVYWAYQSTQSKMFQTEMKGKPPKRLFPYFKIDVDENVLPLLEDLNEASIRFFIGRHPKSHDAFYFYFDPSCLEKLIMVLKKYNLVDPTETIFKPEYHETVYNKMYPQHVYKQFIGEHVKNDDIDENVLLEEARY